MTKRYLTETQVAEMTGFAKASLRNSRYYRRGIPFIKLARSVRYAEDEVVAWMESHKVRTTD